MWNPYDGDETLFPHTGMLLPVTLFRLVRRSAAESVVLRTSAPVEREERVCNFFEPSPNSNELHHMVNCHIFFVFRLPCLH